MNDATNKTFNEAQFAHLKETLSPKEYEEFISFKMNQHEFNTYKEEQRLEGRKKDAGQDFFSIKDRLIVRHVKTENLEDKYAPDIKVLAYWSIQQAMKAKAVADGTHGPKAKYPVNNKEIDAFVALEEEGHFYKDITLEMLKEKVEADKEADKKTGTDAKDTDVDANDQDPEEDGASGDPATEEK